MIRSSCAWLALSLLTVLSTGCCCVPRASSCGDCGLGASCGSSCDSMGPVGGGLGALAGFASCRGSCGEVYVDEWVSEPPVADNCGYDCGGCGRCGNCQPIRSVLKLLWGRPYMTSCSTGLCGPSCDGGCDSCGGESYYEDGSYVSDYSSGGSSCNCGESHTSHAPSMSVSPSMSAPQPVPAPSHPAAPTLPMEIMPNSAPSSAPAISPSSAKRLNPAQQRRAVSRASATR